MLLETDILRSHFSVGYKFFFKPKGSRLVNQAIFDISLERQMLSVATETMVLLVQICKYSI